METVTELIKQTFYQAIMLQSAPAKLKHYEHILYSCWLNTPLGLMLAIANEQALYLLEFIDRRGLQREIEQLKIKIQSTIVSGRTVPIDSIEQELNLYFAGSLEEFNTPVHLVGSPFQQTVWRTLMTVPYGQTMSYARQANATGKPSASRAVANANGANQLAIIIPCHRIITSNGKLGGYGGGTAHKQWLLDHEKKNLL